MKTTLCPVLIHSPRCIAVERRVFYCLKCKRRRLHVRLRDDLYCPETICLTCKPEYKSVKNKRFPKKFTS